MVVVNTIVVWLHLASSVPWLGGGLLVWLVVMPAMGAIDPPPMRGKFMGEYVRRAGPVMTGAVAVIVATGVYQAITKLSSASTLVSTPWGITLLIKIILGLVIAVLVGYLTFVLTPKMAAAARPPISGGAAGSQVVGPPLAAARLQARLISIAKTNAVLGLIVLLCVALLRSM